MDRENIIRIGKATGLFVEPVQGGEWAIPVAHDLFQRVEAFYDAVFKAGAEAEREAYAKVCESFESEPVSHATVAYAIRARGEVMNRDDVIRMVKESGGSVEDPSDLLTLRTLENFAALVAAAEREECAKACKDILSGWVGDTWVAADTRCAAAIRARGEKHD